MMDVYFIWLSRIQGVGPVTQKALLSSIGDPLTIYLSSTDEIARVVGTKKAQKICASRSLLEAERIAKVCKALHIFVLTIDDPMYPFLVKEQVNAPILFYYKGQFRERSTGIGIVGTRRCTEYGKRITGETVEALTSRDIPVVSGLAKGIEAHAHTVCIQKGGFPVAVVGFGLDHCYPSEHISLLKRIMDSGVVLSPFPPGTPSIPGSFALRNTSLAAWSEKILITEAGEKSGVFGIAAEANKLNRPVYAAPNSIYSSESRGCNQMIADGRAKLLFAPQQLCGDAIVHTACTQKNTSQYHAQKTVTTCPSSSDLTKPIMAFLQAGTCSVDDIQERVPAISRSDVMETLCMLEIDGCIRIRSGNHIELC